MTLKAHASKPLTREKPPTIYPSKFVLPSTQNEWWRGKDSNLRRRKPADLQSAPVGRLGTPPGKNEPRILISTPGGVNGIGATFAKSSGGLTTYIKEWSSGPEIPQQGPRLVNFFQTGVPGPLPAYFVGCLSSMNR